MAQIDTCGKTNRSMFVFQIPKLVAGMALALAAHSIAIESASASSSCQSASLCVHTNMPLVSQGDWQLISVLNANGIAVTQDKGYCAPTASYFALSVIRQEARAYPSSWTPLSLSNPYEAIFHLGNMMNTDWYNGGTPWSPWFDSGTANILSGQARVHGWQSYSPNETYTVTALGRTVQVGISYPTVNGFRAAMPALALAVKGSSATGGGHIIALNGVEGSFHKFFDPWNRIYNVEASNPYNVLKNPSGFGYIFYNGGSASVNGIAGGTRESIDRSPGVVAGCLSGDGRRPNCWGGATGVVATDYGCSGANTCPAGTYMEGTLSCYRGFRDIPSKISGSFSCKR